jgi:hypothetical protein
MHETGSAMPTGENVQMVSSEGRLERRTLRHIHPSPVPKLPPKAAILAALKRRFAQDGEPKIPRHRTWHVLVTKTSMGAA